MLIAEELKSWRIKNEMTMQSLSSLTGIDQALISKYENGKRMPSEKHLIQLSTGMQIPLNTLRNASLADKISQLIQFNPEKEVILKKATELIKNQPEFSTSNELIATSDLVQQHLLTLIPKHKKWTKLLPLSKNQLELLNHNIDLAFVFDSNYAIGNGLSYKETDLIIKQNKTISGKTLNAHLEAVNLFNSLQFIRNAVNQKLNFNKPLLVEAHRTLFNGIKDQKAGNYRIQNLRQNTPPAFLVEKLMDDFFQNQLSIQKNLHPIIQATHVFERIRSVCPFAAGNEHLALLMMNFILLKYNYPLTTFGSDLQSSLTLNNAIEKAHSDNTNEYLVLFIIEKVKPAIKQHLKVLT